MYGIYLDRNAKTSITAQLCEQIRHNIRNGEWKEGMRLPPTRKLAEELAIARNVVIDTYEQLIAEGYLVARTGSGTYVADGIAVIDKHAGLNLLEQSFTASFLTQSSNAIYNEHEDAKIVDFKTGTPDLTYFPHKHWGRYMKEAVEAAPLRQYDYGDIKGAKILRIEIAKLLYRTKGMLTDPDQIFIVSGTSDGLMLIAQLFCSDFSTIYVEDPTIEFAPRIFKQVGYRIKPVEVDHLGMKLHQIPRIDKDELVLVTPSHQYPSGSILSIQRRQHAMKLAVEANTYLIEDDYDSDFRLKGVPIPPLQLLDPNRVLYIGTFSKSLAPDLRIGFVVMPQHLVESFANLREQLNLRTPSIPQLALARFMQDGRLDRYIFKMKGIYRKRRNVIISALKKYFGDHIKIRGDEAGMHLLVEFSNTFSSIDWNQSASYGVQVYSVEEECIVKGYHHHQISLGYGPIKEEDIELGVQRLHRFVQEQILI